MIDCGHERYGYDARGCNGGKKRAAAHYVVDNGVGKESNYPYRGNDGECMVRTSGVKAKRWFDLPKNNPD